MCSQSLHHCCGTRVDFSSSSPPRHGDTLTLCEHCDSKFSQSLNEAGSLVPEVTTRMIMYTSEGVSSFTTVNEESKKLNSDGQRSQYKGHKNVGEVAEWSHLKDAG